MSNLLVETQKLGQSIWYDNISRDMFSSGALKKMIDEGLRGMTSNPAIFEKSLDRGSSYDEQLRQLATSGDAKVVFEQLAISDIQLAADLFRPLYDQTQRRDGYVSLEVSPYLAHDMNATIDESRRLHRAVARENVMIKVPATREGISAIGALIADGINVNVTLLFALDVYEAAANAYLDGLERLAQKGGDLSKVASVASFFLSRIDTLIDDKLGESSDLRGKVAIACAKLAYVHYQKTLKTPRWKGLEQNGATPQRLLWASTSTKNPAYGKTLYVDALIGPDTVNTVPPETYEAFKAHGTARQTLTDDVEQARETLKKLAVEGVNLSEVTDELLRQGVAKFSEPFDELLAAVEKKRQAALGNKLNAQSITLRQHKSEVDAIAADWTKNGNLRRLWRGDPSLWTNADEGQWLGWLHIVDEQLAGISDIQGLAKDVCGFSDAVVLGMGGSSLCPWVLEQTFAKGKDAPQLWVLDSTVPSQIQAIEKSVILETTLFIVSSKSGSTTEPNALMAYFMGRLAAVGVTDSAKHFIAITDSGSPLEAVAKREGFRSVVHGVRSIGGRYSALSNFGMVPAAIMGIDVKAFLDSTKLMADACSSFVPVPHNPGASLGITLGVLANHGRNKLTFVLSQNLRALGAWLEQLIAESTGKHGKGIIPIDGETLGPPSTYGEDRVFAYVHDGDEDAAQLSALQLLEDAGHPLIRITLANIDMLGQEFFRWEVATAVVGAVIGINPFDQPDVEMSKGNTRQLMEANSGIDEVGPISAAYGMRVFADMGLTVGSVQDVLAAHLHRLYAGDYFAINAFLEMSEDNQRELEAMRQLVRDAKHVATTLGFGPRFLHSTGQLHKGGPNEGVFLEIIAEDADNLPVPGERYGFSELKTAQAVGDYEALLEQKRRVVRVELPHANGLATLRAMIEEYS